MSPLSLRPRALPFLPLIVGLLGAWPVPKGSATTYTWSTSPGSNDWSVSSNWASNSAPPTSGLNSSTVIYNGSSASYPYLPNTYSVANLTFNSASNGYDFNNGNLVVGTNGITQNSASTETFDIPVSTGANATFNLNSGGSGALVFNQGLTIGSGYTLAINASGNNTIGGTITGTYPILVSGGGTLNLAGTLTLNNSAPTANIVQIAGGTLAVGNGGTVNSGVTVADGGRLNISGTGSVNPGGSLTADGAASNPGVVNLIGGTLSSSGGDIGLNNSGVLNQSGGTLTTGSVFLSLGVYGTGVYNLSGGTYTGGVPQLGYQGSGTINQTGGLLSGIIYMGMVSGGSGTYALNGGTLTVASIHLGPGTGTFNFNGGTFQAAGDGGAFIPAGIQTNVRAGGAVIDTNGHAITVAAGLAHSGLSGDPATDGGLVKVGAGTLTLTGTNTYNGGTTIKAGTVSVADDTYLGNSSGAVTLLGGALTYTNSAVTTTGRTFNLGTGTLVPASGGSITYSHATLNGGTLGAGSHSVVDGSLLNGTRATTGTALNLTSGTVTFNNVLLSGSSTLTQARSATLNATGDLTANAATTLTLNGTTNVNGGYLSGSVTITSSGVVNQTNASGSTTPLYLDGSRGVTINTGGLLNAASGTVELGGLLTNNGTQRGVLNVNLGGVVQGSGTFGTVNLAALSTFSATGTISGNLYVANGATVSLSGSGNRLAVKGVLTNNGVVRLERGATLALAGGVSSLVNNGTIDVITGNANLPSGFTNNGLVLDSSVVRVKAVARDGSSGAVTVSVDGYPGHTYQLQRSASLESGSFANLTGVAAQSNPATNAAVMTFAFTDTNPAAGKGFYRVQVDP